MFRQGELLGPVVFQTEPGIVVIPVLLPELPSPIFAVLRLQSLFHGRCDEKIPFLGNGGVSECLLMEVVAIKYVLGNVLFNLLTKHSQSSQ